MLHTYPLISSTHIIHWFNCTCTLNEVSLILLHAQFKKTPLSLLYHRIANNLCRLECSRLPLCVKLHFSLGSTKLLLSLYNNLIHHKQAKSAFETLMCISVSPHFSTSSYLPVIFAQQNFLKVRHRTDVANKNIRTKTHSHTLIRSLAPIHNTILIKTTTIGVKIRLMNQSQWIESLKYTPLIYWTIYIKLQGLNP